MASASKGVGGVNDVAGVEDFARASSAQDKVCCVEEHIEPICEDFFDNGFRYYNYT